MPIFPPVQPRNVIVTGCSTGIGEATARVLRDRGWRVLPTARKPADLQRLTDEGFTPLALDVADADSVQAAAGKAIELFDGAPGAVVNNAGYGQAGAVEDLSRDAMRRQFEVNLFGVQDFTNRLIPVFRGQGYGRIVNISSVLGRVCMPFNAVYSASKFAMEALSDGLRIELHGSGIAVSLVEPGPIESAFRQRALAEIEADIDLEQSPHGKLFRHGMEIRRRGERAGNAFTLPPEAVARKIAHALESSRPRRRYCVTWPAHFGSWARRGVPDGVMDWLMIRALNKRKKAVLS